MTEPTAPSTNATRVLFHKAYPVSFRILNEKMEEKIYLQDKPSSGFLELRNDSGREIHFVPAHHEAMAGPDDYHFALKFRPGILKSDTKSLVKHKIIKKGWTMSMVQETAGNNGNGTTESPVVIYFLNNTKASLAVGEKILLPLKRLIMQADEGTQVTQVELTCKNLTKKQDYSQVLKPHIRHYSLTLINHRGNPVMPIHVGFTGFNAILNDGTPNRLTLRITNQQKRKPQSKGNFTFSHDKHSRMYLYFETDPEKSDYALGDANQVAQIALNIRQPTQPRKEGQEDDYHLVHEPLFQGDTPIWEIMPESGDVVLQAHQVKLGPSSISELPDDSCLDIDLTNISTNYYMGTTYLYLRLENIPGYWDHTYAIPIVKQPMVFVDRYNVTISIPDPEQDHSIRTAVNDILNRFGYPKFKNGSMTKTIDDIAIHKVKKLKHALGNTGAAIDIDIAAEYVGIGTTHPTNELSVQGSADFSGKVGIGTTEPVEKLTVHTKPDNYGFSHTDGDVKICSFIGGYPKNAGWFGTQTNHDLHFFTNISANVPRMTIDKDGNVGIGKPPEASNKLSVEGNVKVTGNIGIGKEPDTNKLSVSGNVKVSGELSAGRIKMTGGSPGQGKLLMSNFDGSTSWTPGFSVNEGKGQGGTNNSEDRKICSVYLRRNRGGMIFFSGLLSRAIDDNATPRVAKDFCMLIHLESNMKVHKIWSSDIWIDQRHGENTFYIEFRDYYYVVEFKRASNNPDVLDVIYKKGNNTSYDWMRGSLLVLSNGG